MMKVADIVIDGNPGAHDVVHRLMYFSDWNKMMRFCKKNGIIGSELWTLFKDTHKESMMETGKDIRERMWRAEQKERAERPVRPSGPKIEWSI